MNGLCSPLQFPGEVNGGAFENGRTAEIELAQGGTMRQNKVVF